MTLLERVGRALMGIDFHDTREARRQIQIAGRVSQIAAAATKAETTGRHKAADRLSNALRHAAGRLRDDDPSNVR
jgi:hypothetical protein